MADRSRLDKQVAELGLAKTRSEARGLILAGKVSVNARRIDKPGYQVREDDVITITGGGRRFVSRGGEKLESAWKAFKFTVRDRICLDGGASTGGFTHFLLENGARLVFAVDVGYGQLAWKLRRDQRVKVLERTNLRHLEAEVFGDTIPGLVVLDLSFISLSRIFPNLARICAVDCEIISLVKPQFEAGRENVGKGGVIREPKIHEKAVLSAIRASEAAGFRVIDLAFSALKGPKGNIEFFLRSVRGLNSTDTEAVDSARVAGVVEAAHRKLK